MKTILHVSAFALCFATSALAQQENPYRVIFKKPLELKGKSAVFASKVTEKLKEEGWVETKNNIQRFYCETTIKIEGRDLAIKNKGIGEHYYGSMNLDCSGVHGHFSTNFNRVLFLGIRNCVQSETVFDQDYCKLEAVAFRKERDISTENGDLISSQAKRKKYYKMHSEVALQGIKTSELIPEGLQLSVIDSVQFFRINLGKKAEEFFIEKPTEASNFAKGQNIYLNANNDVLVSDQESRQEIEKQYIDIMNKLNALPNGQTGLAAFEKALPDILKSYSASLKRLLTMIAPTEFFQAELKLKSLEKTMIQMANTYNPQIRNRDEFRSNYSQLSDEYNRYGTYLLNTVKFESSPNLNNTTNVRMHYYLVATNKQIFKGESELFDQMINNTCYKKLEDTALKVFSQSQQISNLLNTIYKNPKVKEVYLRINLENSNNYIVSCDSDWALYVMIKLDSGIIYELIESETNGRELAYVVESKFTNAVLALMSKI